MKGHLFLIFTIIIESLSIILMKKADGINNKAYLIAAIISYCLTFVGLIYTFKYLPMGWSNAIWAGSSTILVCVLGVLLFKEKFTYLQIFFLFCITLGLVGLNLTGKGK